MKAFKKLRERIHQKWVAFIQSQFIKLLQDGSKKYQGFIKSEYERIRGNEFKKLHERVVNVKKGSRRYTIIFIDGPAGQVRINVGRY
jgi:hypothetical protein